MSFPYTYESRFNKIVPVFLAGAIESSMLAGCGSSSNKNNANQYPQTNVSLEGGKLVKDINECAIDDATVGCVDISIIKFCAGRDLEPLYILNL